MILSIKQLILINIITTAIKGLWLLDRLARATAKELAEFFGYFSATSVSTIFTVFLIYSLFTGFLADTADGLIYSVYGNPKSGDFSSGSKVLGVKTEKTVPPKKILENNMPDITAKSALVIDKKSSTVLFEKDPGLRLASASTTKLMTALVALEIYKLDDVLEVSSECADLDANKAYLPAGTKYTVENLLKAMLISSAGDAACVLANGDDNYSEFIFLMNQKAYQLGLQSTFFTNPVGFDGVNGAHFSNSRDLYNLAKEAMDNEIIRSIVGTKEFTIQSEDESYVGNIVSTNKLLWDIPQTVGVKTGTTEEAGEVLIYEYANDEKNISIIVMGSDDRFSDTKKLLDWTLQSFSWE